MKEKNQKWTSFLKIGIGFVDVLLFWFSFFLSFIVRYGLDLPTRNIEAFQGTIGGLTIGFVILNILFGVYVLYNKTRIDFFYLTIIIQTLTSALAMVLSFAWRYFAFPRSVILIQFLIGMMIIFLWRVLVFNVYYKTSGTKRVMIVGKQEQAFSAVDNFAGAKNDRHRVTHVALDHYLDHIKAHEDEIDIVYLASSIDEDEKLAIYDYCIREEISIFLNTSFENLMMVKPNLMNFEDESIIEVSPFRIPADQEMVKRLADIIVATVGLVITLPITLITAILVKVTSPGPVFYRQTRITKDGREFEILKFRSMTIDAEKSGPQLAQKNDARVTTVGKYIRSLRIDELPQFWNVLVGDMSMVGPRPERPFYVDQFKEANPSYYLRHNVRAGITGYAQVYGKYASDFNSKLNFDLIYIKQYSLLLDIKILLQTIKILFDKVSSSGVDEEDKKTLTREDVVKQNISILD